LQSEEEINDFIEELKKQRIFALDIEHSDESYLGLICLLQISFCETDVIIDPFKAHDFIPMFKPIFENTEICKVLHDCRNDVLWLQIDYGIYLANVLDTFQLCQALRKPQKSLKFLLSEYCQETTNKTMQVGFLVQHYFLYYNYCKF
jgi:ribonuclease D